MLLLTTFKQTFTRLLLFTVSLLVIAAPLVWLQIKYPQRFHALALMFTQNIYLFTLMRWLVILVFMLCWPTLIHYYAKRQAWHTAQLQFWLAQRFRITGWLVLFELFICENLITKGSQWL